MNTELQKIDQKKTELDAQRPLPPALVKNLDEWYATELTYTSNALEGNTLSRAETAMVIEKGLTVSGKSVREHLEATNHAFALDYIKSLVSRSCQDITKKEVCEIHQLILQNIDNANAGTWRKIAVRISGSDAQLPEPLKVPELMDNFFAWLHTADEHPVIIAADAHTKLVLIHPFVDGNGRTARLLMNLLLMQAGYPPVVIHPEDRQQYIAALEKAQKGVMGEFHQFIFVCLEQSLDGYLDAARKSII